MQYLRKGVIQFYWQFIKSRKKTFLALILMPLIWCPAETFAPYLIKVLLDGISDSSLENTFSFLFLIGAIYAGLMAIIEGATRFSNYLCIQIFPETKEEIRKKMLEIILSYPYRFFQSHQAGNLLTSLKNLVDNFEQTFLSFLYGFYPTIITFIVSLFLIGHISKLFAVLFGCWFLGMNIITLIFLKSSFQNAKQYSRSEGKLLGFINDLFRNIIVIKTYPLNQTDSDFLEDFQQETIQSGLNAEWTAFKTDTFRGIISFLFLAFMFAFVLVKWKQDLLTIGDLAFISTICFYVRRSTWMATVQLVNFFKQLGIAKQSLTFLMAEYKLIPPPSLQSERSIKAEVRFKSIEFSYDKREKIYQNFDLYIPQNQKIGIMGPSGVGKTTLIHLLLNLIEPDFGDIHLGTIPIKDLENSILRKFMTYIPQTAPLFHRSIYDNIHYGNPNATYEEVLKAAKACQCTPFISRFELEYDTIIGEDGIKLSGGQRQCLGMARAYLKNSSILILDEATSAMDLLTEMKVLDAVLKLNRTTLIISHRSSVLKKLDRILVIKEGKILQDGPPSEILSSFSQEK